MFDKKIYIERRKKLIEKLSSGIVLFLGNGEAPMNYGGNTYKFRQDSNFLYFFGIDEPDLAGVIDIDSGESFLFGNEREVDDIIWMGPDLTLKEKASLSGIDEALAYSELEEYLKKNISAGRRIHFPPPYRGETKIELEKLLGIKTHKLSDYVSTDLIEAIVSLRIIKAPEEIEEIEKALDISYEMYLTAMQMLRPGIYEREIYGALEGIALQRGNGVSFPIIFSVHGETLHNHSHENLMREGDIAVLDSGAESMLHYASDITRTLPVSGKFTEKQKEIYTAVLEAQIAAIGTMKPGVKFRDVHLKAASVITEHLKAIGLMKGDTSEAVRKGAYALFFPHGLGHMLGLDVHDMEGLGENFVGYDNETRRSEQFGLGYLRFAKKLEAGHVITVEPGIYFIPQLIDLWESQNKFSDFINYAKVNEYRNFGGIRIEDNVLVTENGSKVLGKKLIPKSIEDVERECSRDL
jgi:Xaa-Pro aminopeptidase